MAREGALKGMYNSDRCKFCKDFGAKALPFLCPHCVNAAFDLVLKYYECECSPEYTERQLISPHCVYHDIHYMKKCAIMALTPSSDLNVKKPMKKTGKNHE